MKIHAFLLCWNEIDIAPLVIKHYQKFCDKITILDNHSTDGSAQLAVSLGCMVVPFGTQFFDDAENMKVKNEVWKGSSADWVIVADFDELLFFHVDQSKIKTWLYGEKHIHNTTIFKTIGWQIMSDDWPAHNLTDITNGYAFTNYAKNIIFNPKEITEINYGPGAHECDPKGNIVWSANPLYVLHYKHIGGVQRTIDRYRVLQKRLSKKNRQMGWGCHYNRSPASIRQEWDQRMKISRPLI